MIRPLTCIVTIVAVLAATAAQAQTRAPAYSWTGFYIGAQLGGAWGDRSIDRSPNDAAAGLLLNGTLGALGMQPISAHDARISGVTGGIELGYNWQIAPRWVLGIEADFSASDIGGSGSTTSVLQLSPDIFQTANAEQKIDWWGTVRARFGWLAAPDLLLFGTGGLAFGRVTNSDSYGTSGPPGGIISSAVGVPGGFVSVRCIVGTTCFAGTDSSVRFGWTVGAGGEWRWSERWSLKAEYLYVNLGATSSTSTALQADLPGEFPASYTTFFHTTDFHVARLGVNYRF
jgi:outer membrane immunogenic protein